ncbi:MAG: hypothetical protein ACREXP_20510, partial [Steroidobacteraceae bacterium]
VHWVLGNLNTHLRASFEEVLGVKTAAALLRRIELHYTPNHASWLNMAENRDRYPATPVPGPLRQRTIPSCHRGGGLPEAAQRRSMRHRVDLYASGRGSEAGSPLHFVINVSPY